MITFCRAKEAIKINQSLSALGDVFLALRGKQSHIPYRNSKLTFLLQPCLGGDGKTLMFVNVNPDMESAQESVCSLKFAERVNQCEGAKGGPKKNVTTGGSGGGGGGGGGTAAGPSASGVKREGVPHMMVRAKRTRIN